MNTLAPHAIEVESMRIIDTLLPPGQWTPEERLVVKRLVHTSGDPELAPLIRFSNGGFASGITALRAGVAIFTDVHMVRMGISSTHLEALRSTCSCLIDDPRIVQQAKQLGETRARTAMRHFGASLNGAIVAIGNAPTALREVLTLAQTGVARPALIVGMPVGFVDAAESKAALMQTDLPYISVEGTRGGSPLAAATVNALMRFVTQ